MPGGGTTVERLRQYLRELTPSARLLLIAELERSLLRGEESAGAHFMLQDLRTIIRENDATAPHIPHCARLFFKSFEPYLVDDAADREHPGRIARSSVELLWTWIRRDLLREESKSLTDAVNKALLTDNNTKVELLIRAFQDRVAAAIEAGFKDISDERIYRRMLVQVGTPHAAAEANNLLRVLKTRDQMSALASQLPAQIVDLVGTQLDHVRALIDSAVVHDHEVLLPALLTLMSRLAAPWQLIRLATNAADTDIAARVAETPYAAAVTIVLAELERLVDELEAGLNDGRGVALGMMLKTIHDAMRGLRSELALPVDSTWGRTLAGLSERISELLTAQIECMPDRVRELLRPRPSMEIRPNSELDADDVAGTTMLVEFVGHCRKFAGEPDLNELAQQTYAELQQYLEGAARALFDGLRHAGTADRRFRQSQVDVAARLCALAFGQDFAALPARPAPATEPADLQALVA
jgi:hypothetical protein